jgi:prepilin-type N-terminal cleavage/methylation domain-containing protein
MLRHRSKGFTLVEVIVVMAVCGILTGLLFGPLNDLYTFNAQGLSSVVQATDTRSALRQMEKVVALGNSFAPQSTADATGKTWRWDDATSLLDKPLIVSSYATQLNVSGNKVIATQYSTICANLPQQMSYNTVFFVKNNALYRRVIKPTPALTCDGNPIDQKNTCESPSSYPTTCSGTDAKLLDDVTGFTVQYFDTSASVTGITPTSDSQFPAFKTVTITLTTTVGPGSVKTIVTNSLRMSLINV